ncbi:MAG: hypothetical protein ABEI57_00875 [Halapricum sp.]
MAEAQSVVYGVVGVILLVTLVSGPLVGVVDLTHAQRCTAPVGSGSASVTVDSLPDRATISKGKFGSEAYYLQVPDGAVRLSNVTGQPLLSYDISIPEMGLTTGPTLFLCAGQARRQTLSIRQRTIDQNELDANSYNATLTVSLRADGNETVVREKPIVVEVDR